MMQSNISFSDGMRWKVESSLDRIRVEEECGVWTRKSRSPSTNWPFVSRRKVFSGPWSASNTATRSPFEC